MNDLLQAGVHFGHLTRKWNPKMKEYIFTARDGVHVIDLAVTVEKMKEAGRVVEEIAANGKEVLLVGTKRQASVVLTTLGTQHTIPYIAQRWLGGLLTNFESVRTTWDHLNQLNARINDEKEFAKLTTRDQFALRKERDKQEKLVGGLKNLTSVPGALFVIDIKREQTALEEARKVGIPVIALVDTNVDPRMVDFPIPGNDDAIKSIETVTQYIVDAILRGRKDSGTATDGERVEKPKRKKATTKSK